MSPTHSCPSSRPARVFRVPSAAGSSLILETGGRTFELSHGIERARHGDLLELVNRGFFQHFVEQGEAALTRRWPSPPPSELLTPIEPRHVGKILALGGRPQTWFEPAPNASAAARFTNRSPASLIASGAAVYCAESAESVLAEATVVRHELFLAMWIARRARNVELGAARSAVAGFCVASDFTRRGLDGRPKLPWFGDSPVGSLALGPCFVPAPCFDLTQVRAQVRCSRVDGGERSAKPTRTAELGDLGPDVELAIAALSRLAILHPGDLILIPTGLGMGTVDAGDDVRCSIEGLGELATPVARRTHLRMQA